MVARVSRARACGCWVLGGSEEFCGVCPFACRSNASILAFNCALSASSARMMAWASGAWRAMISSVIPGGIPLLLPNAALRAQISLSTTVFQGVNGYQENWYPKICTVLLSRSAHASNIRAHSVLIA
jgi:hypothetical protein